MENAKEAKLEETMRTAPLACLWGAIALVLFLVTLSPLPFPGLPAHWLATHLGLTPFSAFTDSLWGVIIRLLSLLPGTEAFWGGLLSAVCGAYCVGVTFLLVSRVRPVMEEKTTYAEFHEDHYSRRTRILAGSVAAFFVMVSPPVWVLSTRAMPGIVQLALLMLVLNLFSEYQRTGNVRRLYLLGFLYGIGITEYSTFILFAPVAAILIIRAMLQRAQFSWRTLITTGLLALPPLSLYYFNAARYMATPGAELMGYTSTFKVFWSGILRFQWMELSQRQAMTGMLLIATLAILPWCVVYLLRSQRPAWFFDLWSIVIRWVIVIAVIGAVMNFPYAPWNFTGIANAMPIPYVMMAACLGLIAGEFSLMRFRRVHANGLSSFIRWLSSFAAWFIPVALLVALVLNYPLANGRVSTRMAPILDGILDSLEGRDILLTTDAMDAPILLAAREKGVSVHLISLRQVESKRYRTWLSKHVFTLPRQQSMLGVNFAAFLQDFLASEEGLLRTASLGHTDMLREMGYLVSDRMIFRAEATPEAIALDELRQKQEAFRDYMVHLVDSPISAKNPMAPLEKYALQNASKVANNLGFTEVERGEETASLESFAAARRLDPNNISALMNQLTLAEKLNLPEVEKLKQEFEEMASRFDRRMLWRLGSIYGYVHNTTYLANSGILFAVSGKPRMAEAELRRAKPDEDIPVEVKNVLARSYLQAGDLDRGEAFYQEMLEANPNDYRAILGLARLATNQGRIKEAAEYLRRLEAMGVKPEALGVDLALLLFAQGRKTEAAGLLMKVVEKKPEDTRAWALLATIYVDGGNEEIYTKAIDTLKWQTRHAPNLEINLLLAEMYIKRNNLPDARQELENITRMNPNLTRTWEMLLSVDFAEQKTDLAKEHAEILLTLSPRNYYGNLIMGSIQVSNEHYALAESSYRTALESQRTPTVLNDLAYLIFIQRGNMEEALTLVDEALKSAPNSPVFLSTRAEILVALGRVEEAADDIQGILAEWPDHAQILFLAMKIYDAQGKTDAAFQLAQNLSSRLPELHPWQQEELSNLLSRLRR